MQILVSEILITNLVYLKGSLKMNAYLFKYGILF
jgi:hypothetical protein